MIKTGTIYMHCNKINGKKYIGQTTQKLEYRWNHGKGYCDSPLFYNAIQKYGWDNFEHIILETDIPEFLLNEKEQFWIKKYRSDERQFGYNLTIGGTGKLNLEQKNSRKEKFAQWRKQHPMEANHSIQKMQQYWKEHPNEKKIVLKNATEKAKQYWEEHYQKKQEVMNKMRLKAKEKNIKTVYCIETKQTYESAREAYRQTGIHYASIGKVCNGKMKTAGGFHWCFWKGDK